MHRKRKQRVRVKLISTAGSQLDGTVRLKANKAAASSPPGPKPVAVSLAPAGRAKLRMRIPARARLKLAHGKKVKVTAVVRLSDANGRNLAVRKSRKVSRRR